MAVVRETIGNQIQKMSGILISNKTKYKLMEQGGKLIVKLLNSNKINQGNTQ